MERDDARKATPDPAASGGQEDAAPKQRRPALSRYMTAIPAIGLFAAAIALSMGTLVETVLSIAGLASGAVDLSEFSHRCIEYADLFLLAVALYILALGLERLFITDKFHLPAWLEFHSFEDLKERLVGVVGVMLGVYFLGVVLDGKQDMEVLWLGLGIAAVVVALGYFSNRMFK